MEAVYVPRHDTQYEPRTKCSPFDCNMAAAADALRFWSLGLRDKNHHELRALQPGGTAECSDATKTNDGTTISEAAHVLVEMGAKVAVYDTADGQVWSDVQRALDRGEMLVVHGDYGSVPVALRGPIDRTFTGLHSVVYQRRLIRNGVPSIRVGDGLSDGWLYWPETVAKKYMVDFPGTGLQFIRVIPRKAASKSGLANVRVSPTRSSAVLTRISTTSRLHMGGAVPGESIGGNRSWYKVYAGTKGIGYVHSSVAVIV